MCIFKNITDRYCDKILTEYKALVYVKFYPGKEAELLIQRNEYARCLIKTIKTIEVKESNYEMYFKQILKEVNSTLPDVIKAVEEYNNELKATYTTDYYESFFTPSLINFINALRELIQKSPLVITNIKNDSLFTNSRKVPWIYQSSCILYEYILDREFEIATGKVKRDIFDEKRDLIIKYVENAANLYSQFENNENDSRYKQLMSQLLENLQSKEKLIQRRQTPTQQPQIQENNSSSSIYAFASSFFTQTVIKVNEKIVGKNHLGQTIDFLITEFDERTPTKSLTYV